VDLQGDLDLQQYLRDPTYRCAAIEPAGAVQERVVAAAERLRAEGDGPVLLISHGDPIKLLLAHYLSMELAAYRRIAVNTGSLSVLRFDPRFGSRLVVVNWKPPGAIRQFLD
jgi:broad specificity phosphatase PhoE